MGSSGDVVTKTALCSCIRLSHRDDVTIKRSLGVDDDDDSALKQAQAHGPIFTIIPADILELQRAPGKDTLGIDKIQAALLQSPQTLGRIKADHREGIAG